MSGNSAGRAGPRGLPDDLLDDYLPLIRKAVAQAAARRAAPFQDDIAQAVVTAVWRQLERGHSIEQPAAYVYKAVIRETVRVLRREQRREEVPIESETSGMRDRVPGAQELLEQRELGRVIAVCLGHLAEDRARAVRAHLAGFDVAETMTLYGWTYQRARNLVARGMADLRAALRARGVPP